MAASFALIRKHPRDVGRSRDVVTFFRWALENRQGMAAALDYLPLSPLFVREVESYRSEDWGAAISGPSFSRERSQTPG